MLHGTVRYVLRTNLENEVQVPWAGRVVFNEQGKMRFYQVYLVCFFFRLLVVGWC